MIELVAFSGYAQAGKDTAAQVLIGMGYKRLAFADRLREMALAINPFVYIPDQIEYNGHYFWKYQRLVPIIDAWGWDFAKENIEDVRVLLQRIGTEAGRQILGNDIWVDATLSKIEGPTVITDCRFPNEAIAIQQRGGIVIRIDRPGVGPKNDHPSETSLTDWPFDARIMNDGPVTILHRRVLEVVQ